MRGGIQRLALVFLGLLIGGVACEVGLWLIGRGAPAASQEAPREKGLMRPEQQTGWIPREGARLEKTDLEGRPYEVRINSSGQRGGEVGPRWPEQRRLLFLGDSFTMADQVRELERQMRRLHKMVRECEKLVHSNKRTQRTLERVTERHQKIREIFLSYEFFLRDMYRGKQSMETPAEETWGILQCEFRAMRKAVQDLLPWCREAVQALQ